MLSDALNETLIVAENGKRRKITKRVAIITQLVNRSAKPDLRALKIVLDLLRHFEPPNEPASSETSITATDEKVIEQLLARLASR